MVVSVIDVLSSFVGAVIIMIGATVSIIYDWELIHSAPIPESCAVIVIVSDDEILLIIHVTGVAYGSVVSPPAPVQVPRPAPVVFGIRVIFVRSFPVGAVIVTVESVIVVLLRVVGAFIVTIGGNLMIV